MYWVSLAVLAWLLLFSLDCGCWALFVRPVFVRTRKFGINFLAENSHAAPIEVHLQCGGYIFAWVLCCLWILDQLGLRRIVVLDVLLFTTAVSIRCTVTRRAL